MATTSATTKTLNSCEELRNGLTTLQRMQFEQQSGGETLAELQKRFDEQMSKLILRQGIKTLKDSYLSNMKRAENDKRIDVLNAVKMTDILLRDAKGKDGVVWQNITRSPDDFYQTLMNLCMDKPSTSLCQADLAKNENVVKGFFVNWQHGNQESKTADDLLEYLNNGINNEKEREKLLSDLKATTTQEESDRFAQEAISTLEARYGEKFQRDLMAIEKRDTLLKNLKKDRKENTLENFKSDILAETPLCSQKKVTDIKQCLIELHGAQVTVESSDTGINKAKSDLVATQKEINAITSNREYRVIANAMSSIARRIRTSCQHKMDAEDIGNECFPHGIVPTTVDNSLHAILDKSGEILAAIDPKGDDRSDIGQLCQEDIGGTRLSYLVAGVCTGVSTIVEPEAVVAERQKNQRLYADLYNEDVYCTKYNIHSGRPMTGSCRKYSTFGKLFTTAALNATLKDTTLISSSFDHFLGFPQRLDSAEEQGKRTKDYWYNVAQYEQKVIFPYWATVHGWMNTANQNYSSYLWNNPYGYTPSNYDGNYYGYNFGLTTDVTSRPYLKQ